jgi:predicted chitinase
MPVNSFSPSRGEIEKFFPSALPQWRDAMVRLAPELCAHYEFDRLRWVHFCGQIGAETNGLSLSPMEEDMRFKTPERIIKVYKFRLNRCLKKLASGEEREPAWAKGLSLNALAKRLVGRPKELADIVYGDREGTPWMMGSRYVGRGPTQCTHLNNYRSAGIEVAKQPGGGTFDLVARPELLAHDPDLGIRVAFAEWHTKGLNRWADADDLDNVSSVLNTGKAHNSEHAHGMDNRKRWYAKAISIWPDDQTYAVAKAEIGTIKLGDSGEKVRELQELLRDRNYFAGKIDGEFGSLTEDAVILFQKDHGLLRDGKVGALTLAALEKAPPRDLGEREQITEKELADRGSQTVKKARVGKWFAKWFGRAGVGGPVAYKADEALGLGAFDAALSKGEQVKSLVGRGVDLASWLPPGWVIWIIVAGAAAYGLYYLFESIVQQRVRDAQTGAHRGR